MIQKIIPIAASITLIGSASLTAYADMVLSISLDTFFSKILTKQQIIQHRTSAVSLPVEVRR